MRICFRLMALSVISLFLCGCDLYGTPTNQTIPSLPEPNVTCNEIFFFS